MKKYLKTMKASQGYTCTHTGVLKNRKGITLVALVVTIILLLILAGITLNSILGERGIFRSVNKAALLNKKGTYFEEIKLEILEEQIQRNQVKKMEPLIASLKTRIENKEWVKSVIMCDENLDEKENIKDNTILIITTEEEYEIFVDVDNSKLVAIIREEVFKKAGQLCKITYDANTGIGTMEEKSIRKGFSIVLSENEFTKESYSFKGWSKYQSGKNESGQEEIYEVGSKMKVDEDIMLYAIWSFVDNTEPILTTFTGSLGKVNFAAKDDESGILGYALTKNDEQPEEFNDWTGTSISQNVENNEYNYLWIKNGAGIVLRKKFKIHQHIGSSTTYGGCYTTEKYHSHTLECRGPHLVRLTGETTTSPSGNVKYYYVCVLMDHLHGSTFNPPANEWEYEGTHCGGADIVCGKTETMKDGYSTGCGYEDGQLIDES